MLVALALGDSLVQGQVIDGYLQAYGEDRIKVERVPEAIRKLADTVTPKAKFTQAYLGDNQNRLVGKTADGRVVEALISDQNRIEQIRVRSRVEPKNLPKAVQSVTPAKMRQEPELFKGFNAVRTERVETRRVNGDKPEITYEFEGRNAEKQWVILVVEGSGLVKRAESILVHPNANRPIRPVRLSALPDNIKQAALATAPGYRFFEAMEETPDQLEPTLLLRGRNAKGRLVELTIGTRVGEVQSARYDIPGDQVPPSVMKQFQDRARTDERLRGFRPLRFVRSELSLFNNQVESTYWLYGRDAGGEPTEVSVGPEDRFSVAGASEGDLDEAAQVAQAKAGPAGGSGTLKIEYAYWGGGQRWDDVTELVRAKCSGVHLSFVPDQETLTEPVANQSNTLVVAYSVDGRVGLATGLQGKELAIPTADFQGETVPARGFQVLKATWGLGDQWADVSDSARTLVRDGRLEVDLQKATWADPVVGKHKNVAILYVQGGKVGLWTANDEVQISLPPKPGEQASLALPVVKPVKTLEGHEGEVQRVLFSADGNRVFSSGADGSTRMWNVATGRELQQFRGAGGKTTFAFGSDGRTLVTYNNTDKLLHVWTSSNGKKVASFAVPGEPPRIAVSRDGRLAALASWDRKGRIVDLATGLVLKELVGHTDVVITIAFTRDAKHVVTGSWDGTAKVWDVATGRLLKTLETKREQVGSMDLSRDGAVAATAASGGLLSLWEIPSGAERKALTLPASIGWAISLDPNQRRLLGTDERAMVLFDLTTGKPLFRFEGHQAQIVDIAFSPDGLHAATASQDGTVKLWDVPRRR